MPATGVICVSGSGTNYWRRTGGVGAPGLWYQLVQQVGVFAASHWGRSGVCPENPLLGGTRVSEASEGLRIDNCSRTMGHSWLLQGCLYLPQIWCACACVFAADLTGCT